MKKYLLAITASALMFAACSNDENILDENDNNPVTNPVTVNFSAGIASRAIGNTWQKDDLIGISATGTDNIAYTNVQYKVAEDGASATFNAVNSEQAICFQNTGAMVFSAYHPYADVSTTDGKIAKNTAQTQDGVDFLWAKIDNVNYSENPIVNFTFIHKMSQINVKLTPAAGVDISGKDIVIGGLKHDGTFNTANGQATANTGAVPENWTVGTPASNGEFTYTGLIYPQNANSLTLTVGDKTATLRLDGDKFDPGHKYTITATAENNRINAKITIEGNTIQDWEDGSGIVKTAFIGIADNVSSLTDEAKAAANWMLNNIEGAEYVSISKITDGTVNLSDYKMIWAHFDWTESNSTNDGIVNAANDKIKTYYQTGGNILTSRDATRFVGVWGITKDGKSSNNNWGGDASNVLAGNQGFYCNDKNHAIFNGLNIGDDNILYLRGTGLTSKDRVMQWATFGDYSAGLDTWKTATGGIQLGADGGNIDKTVRVAEFPSYNNSGKAIVIGDPSFEWNGSVGDNNSCYNNLNQFTNNVINYLTSIP